MLNLWERMIFKNGILGEQDLQKWNLGRAGSSKMESLGEQDLQKWSFWERRI